MGGIVAITSAAFFLVLFQVPACAKDLIQEDGRWVHRSRGFSIADPTRSAASGARWSAVPVEGSVLSFRESGGASMSLVQQCGVLPDDLRLLARELLIGLDEREIIEEGPVSVGGAPGWRIAARARHEGRAVRLRAVTRRLGPCSVDFLLIAPQQSPDLEADFQGWWGSFRASSAARGAEP